MKKHGVEPDPNQPGGCQARCSWEEMVRTQQRYIYRLAYHLCGSRGEAEDLVQETFLKAFENLDGFRQEAGLRTWLCRITVNTYLARRRRRTKHESISLGVTPVPDWSGSPERVVIKRELVWCINHTLQQHVSRDHRTILVLREIEQLSYEEIAEVLNISVSAVKSRLHRARLAFRDHLLRSGCAGLVEDYACFCEGVKEV
ncbi:MAG: RNA polymerase sigma factor [Firmicutes bacterium]|nr:RNA polymerase sigma factor [Bacillota bacterium]